MKCKNIGCDKELVQPKGSFSGIRSYCSTACRLTSQKKTRFALSKKSEINPYAHELNVANEGTV